MNGEVLVTPYPTEVILRDVVNRDYEHVLVDASGEIVHVWYGEEPEKVGDNFIIWKLECLLGRAHELSHISFATGCGFTMSGSPEFLPTKYAQMGAEITTYMTLDWGVMR